MAGDAWGVEFCVSTASELQTALTTAQSNGQDDIVKVVRGTYTGNFTYASQEGKSIALEGGYTSGCIRRVRNPEYTILDANHTGKALELHNNSGGNILVDGFMIRNGSSRSGSGIDAYSTGSVSDITLTNNIIKGNSSEQWGGGAIVFSSGNVTLTNNIITGNSAGNFGGGVYAKSYSYSGTAGTVIIQGNIFQENVANLSGGGIFADSSSELGTAGAVIIEGNTFKDNRAYNGGGAHAYSHSVSGSAGTVIIRGNRFIGNLALNCGGGALADSYSYSSVASDVLVANNIFAGNSGKYGGGLYAESNSYLGIAGGTITCTNNTLTGNKADEGGGTSLRLYPGGIIRCYNNIIWGNKAESQGEDIYVSKGTGLAYAYFNDYSYVAGDAWDGVEFNINDDPLFAESGHWQDNGTPNDPSDDVWMDGDYHLRPGSPCIDDGLNTAPSRPATDFEGDDRILDGDHDGIAIVDMGADEYQKSVVLSSPGGEAIFDACTLINKYQPPFQWVNLESFKKLNIYFSTSNTDFSTKGVLIAKANIQGKKNVYNPSIGTWKKIMVSSYNDGSIQDIFWKVVGTRADKSVEESEVRSFRIEESCGAEIISPPDGASLPAGTPPTFVFDTYCNVGFRMEFSPLDDFSDPKMIKGFTYKVRDPNLVRNSMKTLTKVQWTEVKKLIGAGTGYFRLRAWDAIKRETVSETRQFTISP